MKLRNCVSAGALAAGFFTASPALAGDKQDFETCDGRVHPGRQDDGMRAQAGGVSYFPRTSTASLTIAACDRALASSRLLPTQTLRRAHLLRAQAAAYLQIQEPAKALVALALAQQVSADRANDRFYQRSMGVSIELLRSIAFAQMGDKGRAASLAHAAMAKRPYSSQVQEIGAELVNAVTESQAGVRPEWAMAMRLSPSAASSALIREADAGNFAATVALRPSVVLDWPAKAPPPGVSVLSSANGGLGLMSALVVSLQTAYAYAATGSPEKAKAELAEVRSRITALQSTQPTTGPLAPFNVATLLNSLVENKAKQVEARVAVAEGRYSDALAMMVGAPMPKDAATVDLLTALKAAAPAKEAALVPDASGFAVDRSKRQVETVTKMVKQALIAPETPRAVVDYERSRPNILGALVGGALSMGTSLLGGINRLDGFRSVDNADGTTKVEFTGNTPSSTLVQEMTLLRAAELAHAAKKPAFVILDRKDYSRTMTMSRGGVPISSTPTGYKTEMTVRFLDSGDQSPRALNALSVIDALGPLYYEENRKS